MPHHERTGRPVDRGKDEAILNTVCSFLFTKEPQPFSLEQVARHANVSKTTIYSRYNSREELIEAAVRYQADKLTSAISINSKKAQSLEATLIQFGIDLLTFLLSESHLGFLRTLSGAPEITPRVLSQIYQQGPVATLNKLAIWLQRAHENGEGNFEQPEKKAELLISMFIGFDFIRALYGEKCQCTDENIETHVTQMVDAFLKISTQNAIRP